MGEGLASFSHAPETLMGTSWLVSRIEQRVAAAVFRLLGFSRVAIRLA